MGEEGKSIFAERLREIRNRFGMNQKEFAAKVGVTPATLSAYENGIKNPSIQIAAKIARSCGASLDWMCAIQPVQQPAESITVEQTLKYFGLAFSQASPFRLVEAEYGRMQIKTAYSIVSSYTEAVKSLSDLTLAGTLDEDMYRACIDTASKKTAAKIKAQKDEDESVPFFVDDGEATF